MLHPELGAQRALITMSSTQLKKGRKWLTQAQSMTAKGKKGVYILPLMSQVYKLSTVSEQNDKGNWFGWEIMRERPIDLKNADDKALFDTAFGFAKSVKSGEVQVKEDSAPTQNETVHDDSVM
jgi:hypothetical protein